MKTLPDAALRRTLATVAAALMFSACGDRPASSEQPPAEARLDSAVAADAAKREAAMASTSSSWRCGDDVVRVTIRNDGATMSLRSADVELVPVVTASGAKYATEGDGRTSFWNKGETATVELRGDVLPECIAE